jgi:hypothetical protein
MKCSAYAYLLSGSKTRRVEVAITPEAFEKVRRAQQVILVGLQAEEKFHLLAENYGEWEAALLTIAQRYIIWSSRTHDEAMDERLLLDRRLVNLLTACKLYLDQSEHALSELFGAEGQHLAAFKAKRIGLHGANFGYRLMDALRNYVQHRALPLGEIRFQQSAVDGPGAERIEITVVPGLLVDELKRDSTIKKALIDELGEETSIDLRKPVRDYVKCIATLHEDLRTIFDPAVKEALGSFRGAQGTYAKIEGESVDLPALLAIDESDPAHQAEEVALVNHLPERYEAYRRRTVATGLVGVAFASNSRRTS